MNYETQTNKQENEMKEAKEVFVKNAITREKSSWQVRKMINTLIGINKENGRQTIKVRKNILDYKATVKVYDHECICTYKSDSFVTFHALLKGGKIGVKNTAFLKVEFDHVDGYEWKNIYLSCTLKTRRTLSGFVNK